ncbi:alpha/beta hydrolase fold domain-containing protein [Tichowtungia aerotolerans]|uniref:Alpha/beta hydrolase fold domain-containing protein n=2 Tax=Tichowtungia aerotolerans TaxID=2697043 RepID=A0A6P1MHA0_9BACT|nr:alpha/beta hydrolase fold domain-containing protein [Tichowtungia aerotolerans]
MLTGFFKGVFGVKKKVIAAVLVSAGCVMAEVAPDEVIEYKETPQGSMTLHVFNPPNHTAGDKTPGIVFFFGGGWKGGAPTHFYPQSRFLASRGMVAICADYRTAEDGTSPQECVKDGKSAMRWVRSHAEELGVDPDMLAAGGGSAGGHVAAATATLDGFNEEGEDLSVSCRPDALVLFNPVFDNGPDGYGYDRVSGYWKDFSPLHNLMPDVPPTLIQLGTRDQLIPVATAEAYKARMGELGVRCDLLLYEGQEHGFFNTAKYEETLRAADEFLMSLDYLPERNK